MTLSHVPSTKKRINRIYQFEHWPASIKTTIEWFSFLDIMKYTGNDIKIYSANIIIIEDIFNV